MYKNSVEKNPKYLSIFSLWCHNLFLTLQAEILYLDMTLEILEICKKYGGQLALDDVSMSFDSNMIVGLLGPNGAGKSTLMKIVTGYESPDGGTVTIDGKCVGCDTAAMVGYLPEHNPLYLDMYVVEYLEFVKGCYGCNADIPTLVKRVGLSAECGKRLGQLSKGYRQRVGIAAAIIHDPKVLILDEPTTGLDPAQLVEIRGLIKELSKDRLVLLSTHIMQEVEAMCDEVVMLKHGRIVRRGKVSEMGNLEDLFLN